MDDPGRIRPRRSVSADRGPDRHDGPSVEALFVLACGFARGSGGTITVRTNGHGAPAGGRSPEALERAAGGTVVLDPYSAPHRGARPVGPGERLLPRVVIECDAEQRVPARLGEHPAARHIHQRDRGRAIHIGDSTRIGEGGARITADRSGAPVEVGHRTRIVGGAALAGPAVLGDGESGARPDRRLQAGCDLAAGARLDLRPIRMPRSGVLKAVRPRPERHRRHQRGHQRPGQLRYVAIERQRATSPERPER